MNYTVFDVETANARRDSICSIGIVRVEDDKIVYKDSILINPETEFNSMNVKIHGITEDMVSSKPNFAEVWKNINQYFSNTVLVAHNAKSMDLCALYRSLERYGLPLADNEYICTYELARNLLHDQLESFRLDVLCQYYGIDLQKHHDSLCDTIACYNILKKLNSQFPGKVKPLHYYYNCSSECSVGQTSYGFEKVYSSKTKDMQELQVIVNGIIEDDSINREELDVLNRWLQMHDYLLGFYPFDKIYYAVEAILDDNIMDSDEEKVLLDLLDRFINPDTTNEYVSLDGKVVCLSGDFSYGTKKDVENYISGKGGVIAKNVTKKVDVLILGEAGSAAWKYGNYGSKYEKARQLQEKGSNIIVVKEQDIIK